MITFEKELIYTGQETRKSQKTDNDYTLLSFLGENGQTFTTLFNDIFPNNIKPLDSVVANLKLTPGRYFRFETLSLEKV